MASTKVLILLQAMGRCGEKLCTLGGNGCRDGHLRVAEGNKESSLALPLTNRDSSSEIGVKISNVF